MGSDPQGQPRSDVEPPGAPAEELGQCGKRRLSAQAYPREVEFVDGLPEAGSGTLQRFVLRNAEAAKAR